MTGYYVSVIDGRRRGLILGPFTTHAGALDRVDEGRRLARTVDDRACWYAYGTARIENPRLPAGRLNHLAERAT